ncbi:hypothetical protein BGZ80_003014 [Entomortierella chlamydospora]|uniref:C2H2-type domain-containing protein n=1 Tax=Entomortierella chlamydospora TaxID=101097 RepID=A0A9P6SX78_9FUNG|nr:hypothetical protein BGZ79_005007 [Entomortierella chlamydospora]KAG0008822.1 hypothetical protein BGZ80_003014 [Entomortierella chlamydospora]
MDLSSTSFRFDGDFERQQSPSLADNLHAREFETAFCRDFHCCGLRLLDLHDLLQHYEECHVRFGEDDLAQTENESDSFDEDGWSDSDSPPSSPISASPSDSAFDVLDGSPASDLSAAAAHLYPTLQPHYPQPLDPRTNHSLPQHPIIHSTHPLYRRPSNDSSLTNVKCNSDAQALEAFAASLNGPTKRKAAVSLTDIYTEDDGHASGDNSAFPDAIVRAKVSESHSGLDFLSPLAKRLAMESDQRSIATSIYSEAHAPRPIESNGSGVWPSPFSNGQNSGPQGIHQEDLQLPTIYPTLAGRHGPIGPLSKLSTPSFVQSAADILRQRDEVYSLMEDLTRSGNTNAGDKPYRCTVLGCDKAYKNPNGLKYHNLHGHCSTGGMCVADSPESKPYVCTFLECGKRYKNLNGLKYHIEHSHPNLTAALRAHHSGLINPGIFGLYPSEAAMTIAAALQAVSSSPMMMAAASAILTAQAIISANTNLNSGLIPESGIGTGLMLGPQTDPLSCPWSNPNTKTLCEPEWVQRTGSISPPKLGPGLVSAAGLGETPSPTPFFDESVKENISIGSIHSAFQSGLPNFTAVSTTGTAVAD